MVRKRRGKETVVHVLVHDMHRCWGVVCRTYIFICGVCFRRASMIFGIPRWVYTPLTQKNSTLQITKELKVPTVLCVFVGKQPINYQFLHNNKSYQEKQSITNSYDQCYLRISVKNIIKIFT